MLILQHLRETLDHWSPGAFNASLAALLFVALWLGRRFKPDLFAKLPPTLQAWPALAGGAVLAALSSNSSGGLMATVISALGMSLTGLVSGIGAVGLHRTLKESKLPYGNDQIPPKSGPMVVGMIFLLTGCGGHFEEARGPRSVTIGAPPPALFARCITLDDREAFYGGAAKGTAALAGASGLATVPVSDDRAKLALGVSSAVLAAVAVTTGFIAESSATSYVSEGCAK
jgi:hypothetical protein